MIETIFGAAVGAVTGFAMHVLISPAIGGKCTILCRPERAILAGLLIGGIVAVVRSRSGGEKERAASEDVDEPGADQTDG